MFLQDSRKEEQNIGVLSINFESWLKLIYKNPNFRSYNINEDVPPN